MSKSATGGDRNHSSSYAKTEIGNPRDIQINRLNFPKLIGEIEKMFESDSSGTYSQTDIGFRDP
jgi:hypothetical protein